MTLNFSLSQASDNKSITITDTTADWGVTQIADIYAHRTDGTTIAEIILTILGVQYDAIDVINFFSSGLQAGLDFLITPDMLMIDGVADLTMTDSMPDGDYEIEYNVIDDHNTDQDSFTDSYLIYGQIEEDVLSELLEVRVNALTDDSSLYKANIKLLHFTYLMSMINSSYTGQAANLRIDLANLRTMIENQIF